jgi:CMP-N-acetylneuraminic acid synthetase
MNKIIEYRLKDFKNENIIHTHVTNPLLTLNTIQMAKEKYEEGLRKHFDSLFSVTSLYKRMYFKNKPVNHNPKNLLPTQDLIPVQEENAILYIFSKRSFSKTKNRIGKKPILFEMNMLESIDIDYKEEFLLADLLLSKNK